MVVENGREDTPANDRFVAIGEDVFSCSRRQRCESGWKGPNVSILPGTTIAPAAADHDGLWGCSIILMFGWSALKLDLTDQ